MQLQVNLSLVTLKKYLKNEKIVKKSAWKKVPKKVRSPKILCRNKHNLVFVGTVCRQFWGTDMSSEAYLELPNSFKNGRKKFYCLCRGTTTATEVVQFYFRHCGTTAALPADDLAECLLVLNIQYYMSYIDMGPTLYFNSPKPWRVLIPSFSFLLLSFFRLLPITPFNSLLPWPNLSQIFS